MKLRLLSTRLGPALVAAALASACVGDIGEPPTDTPRPQTAAEFVPSTATLYKLTQVQLQNSLRELFGEPLVVPTDLPADDQLYGFSSIAAASATISTLDAEKYEAAAYAVLDPIFVDQARRDALVGCAPTAMADACVRSFLETFTERAWRRPVTTAEIDALVSLGTGIESDLGTTQGLKFTLAAVLQSPSFLFRVEIGEGGGSKGWGVGLGEIGTVDHGSGTCTGPNCQGFGAFSGRLPAGYKPKSPGGMRQGKTDVTGRMPPEIIQRVVRQNFGRFRGCYESALRTNPNLEGRVTVAFVIGSDGAVGSASNAGSTLPDSAVVACVVRSFYGLSFPQPDGGVVRVTYPIAFTPN